MTPPRPNLPRRPGTGDPVHAQPERSISPAPEARRGADLARPAPDPTAVIDAEWSDDPVAVRSADEREEQLRFERAENARLRVELERKSREPPLPSPRAAREARDDGYLPGMGTSLPPPRGRLESHQHIHVEVGRSRGPDSVSPRSARERAGEALRNPLVKALGLLLGALGTGSGGALVADAVRPKPVETPAPSIAGATRVKETVRNLAGDLTANDRADRAHETWDTDEHRKFDARLRLLERRAKRMPDESLEPEAPPTAPPPPRKPDLPERIGP